MTGYQDQWRKRVEMKRVKDRLVGKLRGAGEFPNLVLFSFADVPGVYMDFINWHLVLNSTHNQYAITDYETRLVFKPSWTSSEWLRKSRRDPGSVQMVVESLHLPSARLIRARNSRARSALEQMGFSGVAAQRFPVE